MPGGVLKDRKRDRLVRLGVIRLGHKETRQRQNGTTYDFPVSDDHFLLHDAPDLQAFYAAQGITEVRELRVRLPFPDVARNMPTSYGVWAGGILVCKGDGEYVDYATPFKCIVDEKRTKVHNAPGDTLVSDGLAKVPFDWGDSHFDPGDHVPCPGGAKDLYPHCEICKINAILKVLTAERELLRMGYYQIATGSGRNYDTIRTTLNLIPAQLLNRLVYYLRRVEGQTMFVDDEGKRKKRTNYFIELEPDPEMLQQLLERETALALSGSIQRLSLPEEVTVPVGSLEGIAGEYVDDEPYDADAVDEITGEYRGGTIDADAYEDVKRESVGKDPAELIEQGRRAMAQAAPTAIETPPEENDWTTFYTRCVEQLKYEHRSHASTVKDEIWVRDPQPTWGELWEHMINHQHSAGRI